MPISDAKRKWIERNPDQHLLTSRIYSLNYYYAHQNEIKKKQKEYYKRKKLLAKQTNN